MIILKLANKGSLIVKCQLYNICKITRCVTTAQGPVYAGHSKWANIRHIKAEKDGQKADMFQKISRQIRLAIQDGHSGDPEHNTQLRQIIESALRKNMPMSSIQGIIKKTTLNKTVLKKYTLNLRYKQKVFMVCVLYTDNFPMLKMEIASILRKAGASVIDNGSIFNDYGLIQAVIDKTQPLSSVELEEIATRDAIECGAEDVEILDAASGTINFMCRPEDLLALQRSFREKGYTIESAEHAYASRNTVQLTKEELLLYQNFISKLRQVNGVEDIYDNLE